MDASQTLLVIPLLVLLTYAVAEVLYYRAFSHVAYYRRWVHLFIMGSSTLFFGFILPYVAQTPILTQLPGVFGVGLSFKLELLNAGLIILTGLIFISVTLYQFTTIEVSAHDRSYSWFYLITYTSAVGALLANDLMAFFLFFELVTFCSYGLIVRQRDQNPKVLQAGAMYITMGIFGGLLVLSGILTLFALTGSFAWESLAVLAGQGGSRFVVVMSLFMIGFLVKSAAVPFHFWLVRLYQETPFSLNALSSGILTKLSAFGLLKVVTLTYAFPPGSTLDVAATLSALKPIGLIMIVLAALTMLIGVVMALLESDIRRMLTFHSISQMGYILLGIGIAAYLGDKGALGLSGSLYHMVNHALFKSALFMSAGLVFALSGERSMVKLGGMAKAYPLLGILTLVPVLGITGVVGFNGYASKALLHHAVTETIQYGHPGFIVLEGVYLLVSAATVTSFLKFYWYIFLKPAPVIIKPLVKTTQWAWLALAFNAVLILAIGFNPGWLVTTFYGPITLSTYYAADFVTKYLIKLDYFTLLEVRGMVGVVGLGALMFAIGLRFGLFKKHLPEFLNADHWFYSPVRWMLNRLPALIVQNNEHRLIKADILLYAIALTILVILLIIGLT
jgi:hydrogenase-4 component B